MQKAFSLTRRLFSELSNETQFEVFLKNGNKLTGVVSDVSDRTFIISNGTGEHKMRSLVYFAKVSSTSPIRQVPAHYQLANTDIGANHKPKTNIMNKKSRNRSLATKTVNTNSLSPSDIESQRFYNQELNGTFGQ